MVEAAYIPESNCDRTQFKFSNKLERCNYYIQFYKNALIIFHQDIFLRIYIPPGVVNLLIIPVCGNIKHTTKKGIMPQAFDIRLFPYYLHNALHMAREDLYDVKPV
jgi:hypothetical protein